MRKTHLAFDRVLLRQVLLEIQAIMPEVRARDASAVRLYGSQYVVESPRRAPYGPGGFTWSGTAHSAYHAKAQFWQAYRETLQRRNADD